MDGLIELKGMEFYAYHGHYQSEKQIGARFRVSVKIETGDMASGITDRLADALNYQDIYELVKKEMTTASNLLEHVCMRMLDGLYFRFPGIRRATVSISKMNPPLGGKTRKVTVSLSR